MQNNNDNIFPILRYYAAFCVMFLHFTGYMRIYVPDHAGSIGVLRSAVNFYQPTVVMFAISGFLISASLERSDCNATLFIKKRFFRLYPELWLSMAVYLLVLFLVIPGVFDISILRWIITQGIGIAATPSCMQKFATGSINGPLWYITVLIQLYILVFLFKKMSKGSKSPLLYWLTCALLAFGNLAAHFLNPTLPSTGQKLLERCFIPYAIWFFIGVTFQTFRLYQKTKGIVTLAVLLVVHSMMRIFGILEFGYYTGLLSGMATASITVLFAHLSDKLLYKLRLKELSQKLRKADISYGLYLYHWLFLNLLIHFKLYERFHWIVCLGLFTICTLIAAFVCQMLMSEATKVLKTRGNS
ncbi:acyltransferase family protein [Butyrivibrio sp. JL13D10]|uniref:acyltransferase family protein n=1 Tax=Butyrivibrio sp. JL13D10 TaxID=3236815 RepID=UPI0038B67059